MRIQVDVAEEDLQAAKRRRMAPMWPESWEALAAIDQVHQYEPQSLPREDLIMRERGFADPDRLLELVHSSETGAVQMASLARQWERRQAITVHLLRQQLAALDTQRLEAERKHRLIVEAHWSPRSTVSALEPKGDGGEPTCPMEEDDTSTSGATSSQSSSVGSMGSSLVDENENSLEYWKDQAKKMGQILAENLQREQVLLSKLQESGVQSAMPVPMEELKDSLHRLDNFLHFTLGKAPIIIAHQDLELRYRFIFNPFPGLREEDILGRTDIEICPGRGVEECMEMKREVIRTGRHMQREFEFQADLFGSKTFLVTVQSVFSKSGETLGINYISVDISEEAARREKLILLREEQAMQKAMETELNRTLVITEEAMRAKQMLATMSHEIRSPLSGVVSMAQVLATTKLDAEQRPMVDLMNASGEHVLELINDILDLSKAESGAMKLEAKKFRPRLVVKRVLQLAVASNQNKNVILGSHLADEVPEEVVGDVLRIRQVLTNLVSNAIKFTSKGEVSIKVRLTSPPHSSPGMMNCDTKDPCSLPTAAGASCHQLKGAVVRTQNSPVEQDSNEPVEKILRNDLNGDGDSSDISRSSSSISSVSSLSSVSSATLSTSSSFSIRSTEDATSSSFPFKSTEDAKVDAKVEAKVEAKVDSKVDPNAATNVEEAAGAPSIFPAVVWDLSPKSYEMTEDIWLHCEVTDTGIGIPEGALPSLFEEYTQASTTTARKYGGTGLGLAICKQLVGLMGGTLEVKSKQYVGSAFSFTVPLRCVKEGTNQASTVENDPMRRPLVHIAGSERKVKIPKGFEGKLKQMPRDPKRSWVSIGESPLSGHSKSAVENCVQQMPKEEDNVLSNRSDGTNLTSQIPALETSEHTEAGRENAKTASMKPNIPRKNSNSLKVATSPQSAIPNKVNPSSPRVEPNVRRSPRILLAEDNNVNVVVAQSMLRKLGLALEVVNNGAEAVDALQRSDYDLVLMDVSMPVMDGLEATRLIRKFEETGVVRNMQEPVAEQNMSSVTEPNAVLQGQDSGADPILRLCGRRKTPIIALTANAMAENVAECYNNGMDSFIAKPVTFEKLEQVLKQYIPWSDHRRVQAR
ncbi:unnamed protein product [Calypogeia fissa]